MKGCVPSLGMLALAGHPCPELTLDELLELDGFTREKKEKKKMLEIQTSDKIVSPWTTWFAYGSMGSGKTRAASTFPKPIFIVPANEGSELTLAQLKEKKIDYVKVGKRADGTVVPIRQHLSEVVGELEKLAAKANALRAAGDYAEADAVFPWYTIVLESLSHLGDMLVEDVSDGGKKKMDQQGWGLISSFMRTIHSRLRNFECHIIYTALAKTEQSEGGGIVQGMPALIGSLAEKLPSACDVVVYMEELPGQGKDAPPTYRAFFRKYRWWQARTRFGGFPDFQDGFDFAKLAKIIG